MFRLLAAHFIALYNSTLIQSRVWKNGDPPRSFSFYHVSFSTRINLFMQFSNFQFSSLPQTILNYPINKLDTNTRATSKNPLWKNVIFDMWTLPPTLKWNWQKILKSKTELAVTTQMEFLSLVLTSFLFTYLWG